MDRNDLRKFKKMPGPVGKAVRKKLVVTRLKGSMYTQEGMERLVKAQEKLEERGFEKVGSQRKLNAFRMNILDLVASNFPQEKERFVRRETGKILRTLFLKEIEKGRTPSEIILQNDGNKVASLIAEKLAKKYK